VAEIFLRDVSSALPALFWLAALSSFVVRGVQVQVHPKEKGDDTLDVLLVASLSSRSEMWRVV
jgi:hypothetical protein